MTFTSGRGGRCIGVKLARIEPKAKVSLAATKGIQQGISMTSQHFCNIFPEKFNLKMRSSGRSIPFHVRYPLVFLSCWD
jgi:hypothetical protein